MNRKQITLSIGIEKIDRDRRVVYATLLAPEKVDLQGHIVSHAEIQAAADRFMEAYQVVGEMHTKEAKAQVVESWVDWMGWHVGTKIKDEALWLKIENGEYQGKSIGGLAEVSSEQGTPWMRLTDLEVVEYSLVDVPAVPDAVIRLYKASGKSDETSLAEQIQGGKVKPRVRPVKALREGLAAFSQSINAGLENLIKSFGAEGGEEIQPIPQEDEMNEQQVTELIEQKFGEAFGAFEKKLDEKLSALGKSNAEDDEKGGKSETATEPDLSKALDPLLKKLDELGEKLEKAINKPAASKRQTSDEGDDGDDEPEDPLAYKKSR